MTSPAISALSAVAAWLVSQGPVMWDAACQAAAAAYGWARRHAPAAWEKARYAWALAAATWRVAVVQRAMLGGDFLLVKACAVNEEDGTDAVVTRSFDAARWEASAREATGWATKKMRVEVRYVSFGHKYRAVLRPGDAFSAPKAVERHRGGPKGVMAAELVGKRGLTVDVTRRVHKYQGPLKDFHAGQGLRVGVLDMFPFDDPAELVDNFHTLRIIDAHARQLTVPLECPDLGAWVASQGKFD